MIKSVCKNRSQKPECGEEDRVAESLVSSSSVLIWYVVSGNGLVGQARGGPRSLIKLTMKMIFSMDTDSRSKEQWYVSSTT